MVNYENDAKGLQALGTSGVTDPSELLESFSRLEGVKKVTMISDEVYAICPKTGQPDFYTVEITYSPDKLCIESKSLKLKLQSFNQNGMFCERLSNVIAKHVMDSIYPFWAAVKVIQKPRGGISIISECSMTR